MLYQDRRFRHLLVLEVCWTQEAKLDPNATRMDEFSRRVIFVTPVPYFREGSTSVA